MNEINTKLVNYIEDHSSMIKLTIDYNGVITKANAFAERMAGRTLCATNIKDFFTSFNAKLDIEKLLQDEISKELLNVNTFRNLPETFYFTSFKTDEGMVLIGESDSAETEVLRNTMISLNNELNNLTRELQKKIFSSTSSTSSKINFWEWPHMICAIQFRPL